MSQYKLEIKQVVDYPRCRVYRQFVQALMADRNIRTGGGSGLFYYTVLCSHANSRISYRRIDGTSYTVYPEEWVCSVKEAAKWFRARSRHQTVSIMEGLQKRHLISYLLLNRGEAVKYKIRDWKKYNAATDHNCPCQNETGFFFIPVSKAAELVSANACSEMDIVLDLWMSAVYNDGQVLGSEEGPVAYLRNGTGNPVATHDKLAARWGISQAAAGRVLKKLERMGYLLLRPFPGHGGSMIYLRGYLSAMFRISDVMVDKDEIALELNIRLEFPGTGKNKEPGRASRYRVTAPVGLPSLAASHMEAILGEMAGILSAQGACCFGCPKTEYRAYPLPDVYGEGAVLGKKGAMARERIGLHATCNEGRANYTFELTLIPYGDDIKEEKQDENKE